MMAEIYIDEETDSDEESGDEDVTDMPGFANLMDLLGL